MGAPVLPAQHHLRAHTLERLGKLTAIRRFIVRVSAKEPIHNSRYVTYA